MSSSKDNMLQPPTKDEIAKLSDSYGFNCSNVELDTYVDSISSGLSAYEYVEKFELPPFVSPYGNERKYNKPSQEENQYNAWYVKCNIEGSKEGKLVGKKVAIKDNTAVANIPMMNGTTLMEGYVPEFDATVVQRVLSHGGTIVGKTTCEDMCLSGASYMTTYGPVRNPKNKNHSAGGSSSGSGVVVALGEADLAIGGDQGGSIRIPSSCCGIVGLKPTHGLVPYTGAIPIVPCIDHLGPMARTVADCALFLECLAGYDNENDYRQSSSIQVHEYSKMIYPHKKANKAIKIGVLKEGVEHCDANVQEVFIKAIEVLKNHAMIDLGEVSFPLHTDAIQVYKPVLIGGMYGSMMNGHANGFATKGFNSHTFVKQIHEGLTTKANECSHNIKMLTIQGAYVHEKTGNYHTSKAKTIAAHLSREYTAILNEFDVLVMPTLNNTPVKIPSQESTLKDFMDPTLDNVLNTAIFDITGHPALSLNCGFSGDLPVGLQIVGKHFDEVGVLNCASILEEAFKNLQ